MFKDTIPQVLWKNQSTITYYDQATMDLHHNLQATCGHVLKSYEPGVIGMAGVINTQIIGLLSQQQFTC